MQTVTLAQLEASISHAEQLIAQQDATVINALRRGLEYAEAEKMAVELRTTLERMKAQRRILVRENLSHILQRKPTKRWASAR